MDEGVSRNRRLFAGIALDEGSRADCGAVLEELRRTGFVARYEAPEKLHVTLAFLGYVPPARYDEVVAGLAASATAQSRFTLTLDKLGAFPHERRPRVVFIGAREQGTPFRLLAQSLRGTYAALGFTFKDDSVAHVTIARVKEPKRPVPAVEFAPIGVSVESVTLFESLPDKAQKTSRYEIVAAMPLKDG